MEAGVCASLTLRLHQQTATPRRPSRRSASLYDNCKFYRQYIEERRKDRQEGKGGREREEGEITVRRRAAWESEGVRRKRKG